MSVDLLALIEQVMDDHDMRRDRCETLPVERRPFKHRPRPKTAVIAESCMRKICHGDEPWNN